MWEIPSQFTNENTLKGEVEVIGWKVGGELSLLNDYLYFDEEALPAYSSSEEILKLKFHKNLKFGKFGFDNNVVFQQLGANSKIASPKLLGKHGFYSQFKMFKSVYGLHESEELKYRLDGKLRVAADNALATTLPFASEGVVTLNGSKPPGTR